MLRIAGIAPIAQLLARKILSPPRRPNIPLRQKGRRLETSFLSSRQCDGNSKGGEAEAASAQRGCGARPAQGAAAAPSFRPLSQQGPSPALSPALLCTHHGQTLFAPKAQPWNTNLLPRPDSTFTWDPQVSVGSSTQQQPPAVAETQRSLCAQRGCKPESLPQAQRPR